MTGKKELRSQSWFARQDKNGFYYRSWLKNRGFPQDQFDGRPVIGICNTWSELTPCNTHFKTIADHVRWGVLEAGGFPSNFPSCRWAKRCCVQRQASTATSRRWTLSARGRHRLHSPSPWFAQRARSGACARCREDRCDVQPSCPFRRLSPPPPCCGRHPCSRAGFARRGCAGCELRPEEPVHCIRPAVLTATARGRSSPPSQATCCMP